MTYPCDEIATGRAHVGREAQVDLGYPPIRLAVTFSLEGRLANEEFVAQHAETPQINFLVVHLAFNHLRGQIVEGATEGCTATREQECGDKQEHILQFSSQETAEPVTL